MAKYRATDKILVGSQFVAAGEEFDSDLEPGHNWYPIDDAAEAAYRARFGLPATDRPYDYWHEHFAAVR